MGGAANSKDETRESLSDSKQDSVGASLDETLSVEDSPYQRETTDQVISHSEPVLV